MGDRVSLQFKNGDELSPVLFHHWGGENFAALVPIYLATLPAAREKMSDPFTRREPGVILVDFIAWLIAKEGRSYSIYLGATPNDGDNSDNGHFIYDLETNVVSGGRR